VCCSDVVHGTVPLAFAVQPAYFMPFPSHAPATTEIYPLSLHDALPILSVGEPRSQRKPICASTRTSTGSPARSLLRKYSPRRPRSEEHTSELQSRENLVCRLLLEKKKQIAAGGGGR